MMTTGKELFDISLFRNVRPSIRVISEVKHDRVWLSSAIFSIAKMGSAAVSTQKTPARCRE